MVSKTRKREAFFFFLICLPNKILLEILSSMMIYVEVSRVRNQIYFFLVLILFTTLVHTNINRTNKQIVCFVILCFTGSYCDALNVLIHS